MSMSRQGDKMKKLMRILIALGSLIGIAATVRW